MNQVTTCTPGKNKATTKKGTRANIHTPTIRGCSVSLVSALSCNSLVYHRTLTQTTVNAVTFVFF